MRRSLYAFWSSMNKALSGFIPLYAAVVCILLLSHSMASAGAITIGQITPAGLAPQGIRGITFDGEANPLVLDGSGRTIWRLDLQDASVISTFPLTFVGDASGLAFDVVTGRYFTSVRIAGPDMNLFTVDPFSGFATRVGPMGRFNFWNLATHPITGGDLWLVNDCANTQCTEVGGGTLGTVDKSTGAVTPVHYFGTSLDLLTALAISPQGRFFVAAQRGGFSGFNRIYEIDPVSGESTFITDTGSGQSILRGMAFDPSTSRLYGVEQRGIEPRVLYLIEVTGLPSLQIEVVIDIKPGSDPNCFNNNERGVIPIAIF